MSAIRSRDTGPELSVRKILSGKGYRYRLHRKTLPGCPDIVFPGRKKAIFVHGCFWHGHKCKKGRLPKSRLKYWEPKIAANKERDRKNLTNLRKADWSYLVIWQCQLRNTKILEKRLRTFLEEKHKTAAARRK
jgi:DNA mismatch endonuclease, patch repair protein